jgi:type II secretory pathway pseudopilin PulG
MRGGEQKQGYTIVEVMVFLAISGFMFIIAAGFVSGRQSTAEFKQGMNSINDQVRQVINDVGNGFYPSNGNFPCNGASPGPPQFTGPIVEQGANQGCVFLGKVIQFSMDSDPSSYGVYSIAGRQTVNGMKDVSPSSFVQAQPRPVTAPTSLTENKTIEWSLRVTSMYNGTPANQIGAVGFFGSFNQSTRGSSQTVAAVAIPGSALNRSGSQMVTLLNAPTEPLALDNAMAANPNPDITICFQGGLRQFGSLRIGGTSGQRLATNIRIANNAGDVGC